MKYNDPSEFFKYIIEKSDIKLINDSQKCLDLALELLDSEKPFFKLLKLAFLNNIYKELIIGYKADSNEKTHCIIKSIQMLNEDCFIEKDKAIWAVGWLASIIYPNEWNSFINEQKVKIVSNNDSNTNISNDKELISQKSQRNKPEEKHVDKFFDAIMKNMVDCSAGEFLMGSPEPDVKSQGFLGLFRNVIGGELGRSDDEVQHKVVLSKPFKIGKYPVTQKEYEALMGNNPSYFKGENNPVERVSWDDALEFCEKLNKKYAKSIPKGYKFDLPTEAQWEYACRAETTTSLNNGKNITSESGICNNLDEVGWYDENSSCKTHPVGEKKPNAWGIYDMHGNVYEWCKDWYGDYSSSNSVTDPIGATSGSYCVYRGGSWGNLAKYCRSAYRNGNNPGCRYNNLGFRLALVPVV